MVTAQSLATTEHGGMQQDWTDAQLVKFEELTSLTSPT